MYIDDIIKKLNETSIRFGNIDYCQLNKVVYYLEKIGKTSIQWSEDDFKCMAEQIKGDEWDQWYCEEKFGEALEAMINDHDAEHGISWYSVEEYLDMYCKIKSDPLKV